MKTPLYPEHLPPTEMMKLHNLRIFTYLGAFVACLPPPGGRSADRH